MKFWLRAGMLFITITILTTSLVAARFYAVSEGDTGWTTGIRQSQTASLDLTGSTSGYGTFSRYTEMDFNDVRMKERIGALNGTLDTGEEVHLRANADNDILINLTKSPGTQDYTLTVNETWPVALSASRSLSYAGKNIFACDTFGNNQDYVGTSYLYTTDLRMNRASYLQLDNAWFELTFNDTLKKILEDRFLPDKLTAYRLASRSTGMADLKYRQVMDHSVANEGEERYLGTFAISRSILMRNTGYNETQLDECWLGCFGDQPYIESYDANGYSATIQQAFGI